MLTSFIPGFTAAAGAPSLVAENIFDVFRSGTWQLRHLVGPDAVPMTENRKAMTDEEWVALSGADDTTFFAAMGM